MTDVPLPQSVVTPLTRAALFLVMTIQPDDQSVAAVRSLAADLAGLAVMVALRGGDFFTKVLGPGVSLQ